MPPDYATLGNGFVAPFIPIPISVVVLAVALLLVWFMLNHTRLSAAPSSPSATTTLQPTMPASAVTGVKVRVYALSGLLACDRRA